MYYIYRLQSGVDSRSSSFAKKYAIFLTNQ